MPKNTKLLIAVPTMGSVHPILVSRLIKWGQKYGKQVSFYFTYKVAPVDRARNQIAGFFLAPEHQPSFTHLLMIDSDTIPPEDAIDRLMAHSLPVVSGLTPILSYKEGGWEKYDNCFLPGEKNAEGKIVQTRIVERNTGLQEIFRCGASCLLIERSVLESLTRPHFQFIYNEELTEQVLGEDTGFCDRVRELGIAIHADSDVVCQHHKDIML